MQSISDEQILNLEPDRELKFKGSFTRSISVELKLTNPSEQKVCFKIKTTAPKQYTVRPSSGVLDPEDVGIITLTLHPFEYDPAVKYSHKFMVQSMLVPDGMNVVDVENLWLSASSEQRMDSKLRCALEYVAESKQDQSKNPYASSQVNEIVSRQRLLDENHKLKVEGLRLRDMVVMEQDRVVTLRAQVTHRDYGRIFFTSVLLLLLGAVAGYVLGGTGYL